MILGNSALKSVVNCKNLLLLGLLIYCNTTLGVQKANHKSKRLSPVVKTVQNQKFLSTADFLIRNACMDSETWILKNKNAEAHPDTLELFTEVPFTEFLAEKKLKLLEQYHKQLSADRSVALVASYIFYRSSLEFKLYALAEIGFKTLFAELPLNHPLKNSIKTCIQKLEYQWVDKDLQSSYVGSEDRDEIFFKTLSDQQIGKVYSTFRPLYLEAKLKKDQARADNLLLLYAEELYQRGRFQESIKAASLVDKKRDPYAKALLTMEWSSFRLKDYAQAVGHAYSLSKAYPKNPESLEGIWLASAAFLEVCLPKDGMKTLELYKTKILRLEYWMRKQMPLNMADPYLVYYKKIRDNKVPYLFKYDWLKSKSIYINQARINNLIDGKAKLIDLRKKKLLSFRITQLEKNSAEIMNRYKKEIGIEFAKLVKQQRAELEQSIEKGQLLETDLLTSLGRLSSSQAPAADAKSIEKAKAELKAMKNKTVWVRENFESSLSNLDDELWIDDLGNFVGDFRNACEPPHS